MDYKTKYLKYKLKYLKSKKTLLHGGLDMFDEPRQEPDTSALEEAPTETVVKAPTETVVKALAKKAVAKKAVVKKAVVKTTATTPKCGWKAKEEKCVSHGCTFKSAEELKYVETSRCFKSDEHFEKWEKRKKKKKEKAAETQFNKLDTNNDGSLSITEFT